MKTSWIGSASVARRGLFVGAIVMTALLSGGCESDGNRAPRAAAGSYAFWPQAPDEPRVQFIRAFRSSEDLQEQKSSGFERLIFGEESEYAASIEKPYGLDIHDGRIYVCDIRRPSLTVLDMRKQEVRLVGVTGVHRVTHPVDVAVADDGWIYVADNQRDAILVFDPTERYSRTYGHAEMKPVSIAVHADRLYVCDLLNQRVEIFDRHTGQSLGIFGDVGDEDGQFRVPIGVDVDKNGYVWVSDMMRCRIQKFTPDGEFVLGIGELGDYAGSFARPKQLAVDSDGIVYVVDAAFQNVQMFNDEQALLMHFGTAGDFPGAMNLPAGICVSDADLDLVEAEVHPGFQPLRLIAVSNQFGGSAVSLYALGRLRKGWTAADVSASSLSTGSGTGQNPEAARFQSTGQDPSELPPAGTNLSAPPPSEDTGGDGG